MKKILSFVAALAVITGMATPTFADSTVGAFLQITLKIEDANRGKAAMVYQNYKQPFLTNIDGAKSKQLLVRAQDVQVLHGFETTQQAAAYLATELFAQDVVGELGPLLMAEPEVRIYEAH